jgi:hypothetical protein
MEPLKEEKKIKFCTQKNFFKGEQVSKEYIDINHILDLYRT